MNFIVILVMKIKIILNYQKAFNLTIRFNKNKIKAK
jgi:hypothetical protein